MTDLERVQLDGLALKDISEQTPEICLVAVQQDGWALEYVKEQTLEICLAAIQQDTNAFMFIYVSEELMDSVYEELSKINIPVV